MVQSHVAVMGTSVLFAVAHLILGDAQRLGPDPMADDDVRRTGAASDDVRKLLLRPVGAQNLVETEQVRLVRLPLELVAVPGEAQPNLLLLRVARLAHARAPSRPPTHAQVGENVLETVKGVFHAVLGRESPGRRGRPTYQWGEGRG